MWSRVRAVSYTHLDVYKRQAKKTSVTVIDRSDTAVSVQEDLSYQSIIDRADRTVERCV